METVFCLTASVLTLAAEMLKKWRLHGQDKKARRVWERKREREREDRERWRLSITQDSHHDLSLVNTEREKESACYCDGFNPLGQAAYRRRGMLEYVYVSWMHSSTLSYVFPAIYTVYATTITHSCIWGFLFFIAQIPRKTHTDCLSSRLLQLTDFSSASALFRFA